MAAVALRCAAAVAGGRAGSWRLRCTCSSAAAAGSPPAPPPAERFTLVYRFPGIRFCRALSRLKLLQTGLTVLALPPLGLLYAQGQASLPQLQIAGGAAVLAFAVLYGFSYFLRRLIGLIYLSEAGDVVRVAHLTFWGWRHEVYCPTSSVVVLEDTGDRRDELLLQFKRYDSPQVLYFTLRFGQVVDRKKFEEIFGQFR
ncbi:PREDICTED: transmembrane protein 186 [Crocodylus porosus]|uniref:Transmembrane protein 186 n=1 Tax=Crocodylus porosus TaxID=8502 RepID=A0A7M4E5T6_CROPO|nr:PREDICTED: transmembrane protein 186 [Crocodylus porosus]